MPYIPNTDDDRKKMLKRIGVSSFEDLLQPIPDELRLKKPLDLPKPLSEMELLREMEIISERNHSGLITFAGGGVYDHFIPAALETIISRPEFMTAYTPYQAEVAQGTLQVIYEFQSNICRLTGMDVANASMYDGASAAAEAVSLAIQVTGRNRAIISGSVNPLFVDVIKTYFLGRDIDLEIIPSLEGKSDLNSITNAMADDVACLLMAQPNFFGLLEDAEGGGKLIHDTGGKFIMAVDPIAAALIRTPADCGADIVVGEGQPLGIPLNFGGPLVGFFAVKRDLIRTMPGRLAARTVDVEGIPGFVLTLQTREQHIRRDKATSNICTNQALCATAATVYMTLMGRQGLKRVALLCMEKTHRTMEKILAISEYKPYFEGDCVREFAVKTPIPAGDLIDKAIANYSVLPGINLGRFYDGMDDGLLVTVTEKRTDMEIDLLIKALSDY